MAGSHQNPACGGMQHDMTVSTSTVSGRTAMSPAALMTTRCPGLLYSETNLPRCTTASCVRSQDVHLAKQSGITTATDACSCSLQLFYADCTRSDRGGGSGVLFPYLVVDDAPRFGHRFFVFPREGPVACARRAERVAADVDAVRGARASDVEGGQRGERAPETVTCRVARQQPGQRRTSRESASKTTCVRSRPV